LFSLKTFDADFDCIVVTVVCMCRLEVEAVECSSGWLWCCAGRRTSKP